MKWYVIKDSNAIWLSRKNDGGNMIAFSVDKRTAVNKARKYARWYGIEYKGVI